MISLFESAPFDPTCASYSIDGIFTPTDIQDLNLDPGAAAEYYFRHGEQGPAGVSRTKYEPSGDLEIMTGAAGMLEDYLFNQGGGSTLRGSVSEVPTTFVITLDNGTSQQIVFTLLRCRFYPKGFSVGKAGTTTPNTRKFDLKFVNGSIDSGFGPVPFWQSSDTLGVV
jgi:hypothetical protein